VFSVLADFERDLIRERAQAGLAATRARRRSGGRPRALSRYDDPRNSIGTMCTTLPMPRARLYRYVKPSSRGTPAAA
jgi:hypothetical protein